jgi:hypothetical protein
MEDIEIRAQTTVVVIDQQPTIDLKDAMKLKANIQNTNDLVSSIANVFYFCFFD